LPNASSHFLLIEHSPATDQRLHWMDEIDEFRAQMRGKLSPTIRRHLKRDVGEVYGDGRRIVERKMRRHGEDEAAAALPATCPYTVEQVLGDWLPEIEARSAWPKRRRWGNNHRCRLLTLWTIPLPSPRRPASDRPARAGCVGLEIRPCKARPAVGPAVVVAVGCSACSSS
jgi:hypothetical protein